MDGGAWWAAAHGVTMSRTRLSDFTFTFHFHALEKEMATHSSILTWRIPGTGESGGLPSMGSHRVGHDGYDLAAAAAAVECHHPNNSVFVFRVFWVSAGNAGLVEAQAGIKIVGRNINNLRHGDAAPAAAAKSLQLCPTLCDPIDGSPSGSSVPGILQARILD